LDYSKFARWAVVAALLLIGVTTTWLQTPTVTMATPHGQVAGKLNLNTATRDELLAVPGSGPRMAREFDEYRPYTSILQFRREIGKYVTREQVAAYEQYLFVPIDQNASDVETLKQIPGVDDSVAATLAESRPFDSADAFIARLGELIATEQAEAARSMLVAQ
jgi:DNA uptake protein ComE-like DNA-binding protein